MQVLCEAFLKELKSVAHRRDHKVIDVWLVMLIYANGDASSCAVLAFIDASVCSYARKNVIRK
jgi:Fanconi anemia group D2 protein